MSAHGEHEVAALLEGGDGEAGGAGGYGDALDILEVAPGRGVPYYVEYYAVVDADEVYVEAVGMGNEDFSAFQAGVLAEVLKASGFSVLVKTGYKHSSALNAAGYGGIELYYGF